MKILKLVFLILLTLRASATSSFSKSKKILPKIYQGQKSFYCQCSFNLEKQIDDRECGYKNNSNYPTSIDWEHIVPAKSFGQFFKEWEGDSRCITKKGKKYKGRSCASINPKYKKMEADLHNLVPALSELNRKRRDFPFALIQGEERKFGRCDFEIKNQTAEPTEAIRGDIARTYLYMQDHYKIKFLTAAQEEEFLKWSAQDPPSALEKMINCKKARHMGHPNPFIGECSR